MKKIIAFVLLSFSLSILVSAQALPKKTKISGQLKDNATFTEITVRLPTQDVNIIATSKVEADGKFSLEFSQLETNIYKIFLADNNQIMLILTPGDQVIANLTAVNLGQNPDITGSTETTKLLVAQAKLNEYTHQLDVVNSSWKESMTSPKADSIQAILRAQYEKFSNGQNAFLKDAVAQNKFSLIGLFFIERLDISDDFPTYDLYDQAVMQRYSNNNFIKDFHGRVESERRISLGSMAPDLKFPNPEGVMHSLSELKGKVVLVDFWASWCGPVVKKTRMCWRCTRNTMPKDLKCWAFPSTATKMPGSKELKMMVLCGHKSVM